MADSNITKKALASALKDLMKDTPFEKIRIADICDKCEMHRKSFYYHFKDKYELVDWIFDSEFHAKLDKQNNSNVEDYLSALCDYLYENKDFYCHALKIEGQNSFSYHFHDRLRTIIAQRLKAIFPTNEINAFLADFITDGVICAIERWLLQKDCMEPEKFLRLIKKCVDQLAATITSNKNS